MDHGTVHRNHRKVTMSFSFLLKMACLMENGKYLLTDSQDPVRPRGRQTTGPPGSHRDPMVLCMFLTTRKELFGK
jgi:hypothetical protein